MTRTADETSSNGPAALTKADISSERISRRALLSALLLGTGFAATGLVGDADARGRKRRRRVAPRRRTRGPQTLGQGKNQQENPWGDAATSGYKALMKSKCPGGYWTRKGGCMFDF